MSTDPRQQIDLGHTVITMEVREMKHTIQQALPNYFLNIGKEVEDAVGSLAERVNVSMIVKGIVDEWVKERVKRATEDALYTAVKDAVYRQTAEREEEIREMVTTQTVKELPPVIFQHLQRMAVDRALEIMGDEWRVIVDNIAKAALAKVNL